MSQPVDWIVRNIGQLVTVDLEGASGPRRGPEQGELGLIEGGALAVRGERLAAVGPESAVLAACTAPGDRVIDAEGGVVLPGWIDSHTHLLFAGTREAEFELRVQGKGYMEIAAAGGGIRSSVRQFRSSDDRRLLSESRQRLDRMMQWGTTTVEVKSGYALETDQELRALRLIEELDREHPVDCVATFMGAHEFPDEYREDRDAYVRVVAEEMIPRVVRETRARYCDVFCEAGVFDLAQTRAILEAARRAGLGLRLHADEFEALGGTELAVEMKAASVDHLLAVSESGLEALAAGETVATLLPGTSFSLGKHHYAPGRAMIDRGIAVALATDCNPGSSMVDSIPLVLSLACLEIGLTPAEAVVGATVNGAHALGLGEDRGILRPGYRADFQILDAPSYVSLVYHLGATHLRAVFKDGRPHATPRPTRTLAGIDAPAPR